MPDLPRIRLRLHGGLPAHGTLLEAREAGGTSIQSVLELACQDNLLPPVVADAVGFAMETRQRAAAEGCTYAFFGNRRSLYAHALMRPRTRMLFIVQMEHDADEDAETIDDLLAYLMAAATTHPHLGLVTDTLPAKLLAPLFPLIGRSREMGRIAALPREQETRLVRLTGPGGVGRLTSPLI